MKILLSIIIISITFRINVIAENCDTLGTNVRFSGVLANKPWTSIADFQHLRDFMEIACRGVCIRQAWSHIDSTTTKTNLATASCTDIGRYLIFANDIYIDPEKVPKTDCQWLGESSVVHRNVYKKGYRSFCRPMSMNEYQSIGLPYELNVNECGDLHDAQGMRSNIARPPDPGKCITDCTNPATALQACNHWNRANENTYVVTVTPTGGTIHRPGGEVRPCQTDALVLGYRQICSRNAVCSEANCMALNPHHHCNTHHGNCQQVADACTVGNNAPCATNLLRPTCVALTTAGFVHGAGHCSCTDRQCRLASIHHHCNQETRNCEVAPTAHQEYENDYLLYEDAVENLKVAQLEFELAKDIMDMDRYKKKTHKHKTKTHGFRARKQRSSRLVDQNYNY
eukprot:378437_1